MLKDRQTKKKTKAEVDPYASKVKVSAAEMEKAGKQIEALFTLYQQNEDETLLKQIQEIVDKVDRPFCFNYQAEGDSQMRRQMFLPPRLRAIPKRELMLRLDLK